MRTPLILACFCLLIQCATAADKPKSFLVVAPQNFHAELGEFVKYRQSQLPTTLISLETILAQSNGVDDPEKLKRFLFEKWKNEGLGYVLLVGDADVLPVRYMVLDRATKEAFNYAFYPSDLFYSDLAKTDGSFEDWNSKKDDFHAQYFGEVRGEFIKTDAINYDSISYVPEIALGRWPVSSPEEVKLVASKTLAYEKGIDSKQKIGVNRAAFVGIGGWIDMRSRLDNFAASLPNGWSNVKRYFADKNRNDNTPLPDKQNVIDLLNEGVGLMVHAGHGNDDKWEQSISVRDIKKLKNADRLPIVISAGCSTARFATLPPYEPYVDVHGAEHAGTYGKKEVFTSPPPPPAAYQRGKYNPAGFGEQLLRQSENGAVAYIGCNTGSQPCGLTLLDGFSDTLKKNPDARLGDCWTGAIAFYFEHEHLATLKPTKDWYPPSIFFQGMKFMLFGDPTVRVSAPK